jgi:hypothetical protein
MHRDYAVVFILSVVRTVGVVVAAVLLLLLVLVFVLVLILFLALLCCSFYYYSSDGRGRPKSSEKFHCVLM